MTSSKPSKLLKFQVHLDEDGKTVLRPLTAEDQDSIERALSNPRGVTFGPNLAESKECPLDPEIPYAASICAIEAEKDPDKLHVRQLARASWTAGRREFARRILDTLVGEQG